MVFSDIYIRSVYYRYRPNTQYTTNIRDSKLENKAQIVNRGETWRIPKPIENIDPKDRI